jgi:hypothetical protein
MLEEVALSFNLDGSREQILRREIPVNIEDQARQTRSQTDTLMDVADKLGEARLEAQGLNDRSLLYLINVAIFQAYETLTNQSDLGEREKWNYPQLING